MHKVAQLCCITVNHRFSLIRNDLVLLLQFIVIVKFPLESICADTRQQSSSLAFLKELFSLYIFLSSSLLSAVQYAGSGEAAILTLYNMAAHSYLSSKHLGLELELITRMALSLTLLTLTSHYWQERLCEHVCSDESVTEIKIYSISLSHPHACAQSSLWENQTKYIIQDWQRQSAVDAHCVCTRGSFVTELCVVCVCVCVIWCWGSVSERYTGSSRFSVSEMNVK